MDRRNFMKVLSLVPLGTAQMGFGSALQDDSDLISLPRLLLMDDKLDKSYYSLRRPVEYEKDPRNDSYISGRSTPEVVTGSQQELIVPMWRNVGTLEENKRFIALMSAAIDPAHTVVNTSGFSINGLNCAFACIEQNDLCVQHILMSPNCFKEIKHKLNKNIFDKADDDNPYEGHVWTGNIVLDKSMPDNQIFLASSPEYVGAIATTKDHFGMMIVNPYSVSRILITNG
jgi:hypothetical protein